MVGDVFTAGQLGESVPSIYTRLERYRSEAADGVENRHTELLAWSLERAPSFAVRLLESWGCALDGLPELGVIVSTQHQVRDSLGALRFVDLALEWFTRGELAGRVFVEVKWDAAGEHGDQLTAYEHALRGGDRAAGLHARLVYLAKPGATRPDPGALGRFTIDRLASWVEIHTLAADFVTRSVMVDGLREQPPAAAQQLAVAELAAALKEEGVSERELTLRHLAVGAEAAELVGTVADAIHGAVRRLSDRPDLGLVSGTNHVNNYLLWSIQTHGRLAHGGSLPCVADVGRVPWWMGVMLTPVSGQGLLDERMKDGSPHAVVWLECDPKYGDSHRKLRDHVAARCAGGGSGLEVVGRADRWILALRSRSLLELLKLGSHVAAPLEDFFVESVDILERELGLRQEGESPAPEEPTT